MTRSVVPRFVLFCVEVRSSRPAKILSVGAVPCVAHDITPAVLVFGTYPTSCHHASWLDHRVILVRDPRVLFLVLFLSRGASSFASGWWWCWQPFYPWLPCPLSKHASSRHTHISCLPCQGGARVSNCCRCAVFRVRCRAGLNFRGCVG